MVMVIVEVPEGVMMGGGAAVKALLLLILLPQPAASIREKSSIAVRALFHARRPMRRPSNIQRFLAIISMSKVNARSGRTRIPFGGEKCLGIEGRSAAAPLVDTVIVKGVGVPLAIATLAGAWHTAPSGAPLQTSDTVPL
jgi:hypothetical protein